MKFNKYKEQNGLDTQEKLLKHIDELKRNTVVNQELVNFLVDDFFAGEKRGTNSTRHKSRSGETHTVFSTPAGLKDVNKTVVIELENPLEFPQLKSNSWSDLVQDKDRIVFKNSEEVKTNLKQDNFAGLFNILEPNEDKKTEEDKLVFHFRKEGLPHSDVVVLDSINEAEECAKKNGYTEWSYLGLLSGFINEKDINPLYKAVSDEFLEALSDEVIKNSSREGLEGFKESQNVYKETEGIKESNGKADYSEINLEILDLMAERFAANKHKYPKNNMKKTVDIKSLEWALFRHIKKMIQPINGDEENYREHLAAILCNGSMILDQLNLQESK